MNTIINAINDIRKNFNLQPSIEVYRDRELYELFIKKISNIHMTYYDLNAFSGVYAKIMTHHKCVKCFITEAYYPLFSIAKKRLGKELCDSFNLYISNEKNKPYHIINKESVIFYGDIPVYKFSESLHPDIMSMTADSIFNNIEKPNFIRISGCNICEAILGASSLFTNKLAIIIFEYDNRYIPSNPQHDQKLLYNMITSYGFSIHLLSDFLTSAYPMNEYQFIKSLLRNEKIFICVK